MATLQQVNGYHCRACGTIASATRRSEAAGDVCVRCGEADVAPVSAYRCSECGSLHADPASNRRGVAIWRRPQVVYAFLGAAALFGVVVAVAGIFTLLAAARDGSFDGLSQVAAAPTLGLLEPTAAPTPGPQPAVVQPTPAAQPTAAPSPTPVPSPTPEPTVVAAPTVAPTALPTPDPSPTPAPSPTPVPERRPAVVTHVVGPDENVDDIAARYELTVDTVLLANNLSSQPALNPGQQLRIPAVDGALHRIQPGDAVSSLARLYGVSEAEIAEVNGLDERSWIRSGDLLLIPGATRVLVRPTPVPLPPTPEPSADEPEPEAPSDSG